MNLCKKSLFLAFIILSLFTNVICENIIGVVDIIPLLIFHPHMESYIPNVGHFLNLPKGVNAKEMKLDKRNKLFKQMEKEWKKKARENMGKYVKLERKLVELLSDQSRYMKEYQVKLTSLKKLPKSEFKKELEKIEFELWQHNKKSNENIEKVRKNCTKLKEEVSSKFYLEGEKHQERINQIMEDINLGIKTAVKKYNLSFVFNNSFSLNPYVDMDNGKDPIKDMLFLRNKKNKNIYDVFKRNKLGYIMIKESKPGSMDGEIADRYSEIKEYLKLFSNSFYLKTSLIYGGRDITLYVLYYLFEKYKVPKVKIKAYIKSFKKIYRKRLLGGK
ncbi:hypothetical protein KAJ27_07630 [bacterium]|nr:hypothetical protein [bacterium]